MSEHEGRIGDASVRDERIGDVGEHGARIGPAARVAAGCIRGYQRFISPALPRSCRFHPTCSSYALTSVERFGVLQGGWLAAKRIARCNPWNPGGFDPVPETLRKHH